MHIVRSKTRILVITRCMAALGTPDRALYAQDLKNADGMDWTYSEKVAKNARQALTKQRAREI